MKHSILVIYLLILFFTVFIAGNDYRFYHAFSALGSINFIPFKDKIDFLQRPEDWGGNNMYFFLKEVIGNVLLLFPFPLIVLLLYGVASRKKVLVYSLLLSCTIEIIQLLTGMGNADIDDVILNTFGAVAGIITATWLRKQECCASAQKKVGLIKRPVRP